MAKYVEILFRHRLRFLILIFFLPVEVAGACILLFPHQTAVSSLWVDTPTYISISPAASGGSAYLTPAQNTADALNQLRSTDSFLTTLQNSLDSASTFQNVSERDSVLATLPTDLAIVANGSHLVVLTYTCPRQPMCSNVLNSTEQIYHQWLADQQSAQAKVAIDFYSAQLLDAQAKLRTDETALESYVAAHPGVKTAQAPLIPEFDHLIRNVDDDTTAVSTFQQKLNDTKLTNAAVGQLDSTVLKVIDPPRTVGGRINSLPKKQMVIGAIASLALAVAVLVIMVWSDRSAREPKDIESRLKLPVVATINDLAVMGASDG
jgi:uncharacterized protein involved in exopolysaccharide biosynthesis